MISESLNGLRKIGCLNQTQVRKIVNLLHEELNTIVIKDSFNNVTGSMKKL